MTQVTCCSNLLVKADNISSYVPFLSTVTNLVDLFQKCAILPRMQDEKIWNSHYYTHLDQKSFGRCIALLVPILGNIIIGLYDFANRRWDDKDYVLSKVKQDGYALVFASARLRDDSEVVLAAIKPMQGASLEIASQRLRNDKKFMLDAIEKDIWAVWHASPKLKDDKDVMLAAVKKNGTSLDRASERLRNDREVALAASTQNIHSMPMVSENLRNDIDFMIAAMKATPYALHFMGKKLKNDKDAMITLMKQDGSALQYVGDELKKDKAVVIAAVEKTSYAREYAYSEAWNDKDVLLVILKHAPWELAMISSELRNDKEFMLVLLKQNGSSILPNISLELRDDKDFMLSAIKLDGWALQYASLRLRQDPEMIDAAAQQDTRAATIYACEDPLQVQKGIKLRTLTLDSLSAPTLDMKAFPLKLDSGHSIFTGPAPIFSSDKASFEMNKIKTALVLVEAEKMHQYNLSEFYAKQEIAIVHFPIKDREAPAFYEEVIQLMEKILECSKNGNIYVHCLAGKGRTGTIMACLTKRLHPEMSAEESIQFTRNAIPGAIETKDQEEFIKAFSGEQ